MWYPRAVGLRRLQRRKGSRRLFLDRLEARQLLAVDLLAMPTDADAGMEELALLAAAGMEMVESERVERIEDADYRDEEILFTLAASSEILDGDEAIRFTMVDDGEFQDGEDVIRFTLAGRSADEASQSSMLDDVMVMDYRELEMDDSVIDNPEIVYMTMTGTDPCAELAASSSGPVWHNPDFPSDVNRDGALSPIDALAIITFLHEHGVGEPNDSMLELSAADSRIYADVNGDGLVAPIDVLIVINHLNDPESSGPALAQLADSAIDPAMLQSACDPSSGTTLHDEEPGAGLWEGFPSEESERRMMEEEPSDERRMMPEESTDLVLQGWDEGRYLEEDLLATWPAE